MKRGWAIAIGAVLGFAGGADGKDHRYFSVHVGGTAQRATPTVKYPPEPTRSQDRSDIYGSDAGGRHWYTNPDRDPFGPNPNCGYSSC